MTQATKKAEQEFLKGMPLARIKKRRFNKARFVKAAEELQEVLA